MSRKLAHQRALGTETNKATSGIGRNQPQLAQLLSAEKNSQLRYIRKAATNVTLGCGREDGNGSMVANGSAFQSIPPCHSQASATNQS
jgi:hypothetical protein